MQTVQDLKSKLLEYARGDKSTAGRLFERFIKRFLRTHTFWGNVFKEVWHWNEYPERAGRTDTGIDLVALDKEGKRWAIQVKLRFDDGRIGYEEIAKFITASKPDEFQGRLLVFLGELTEKAEKTIKEYGIWTIDVSDEIEHIDWSVFSWDKPEEITYRKKQIRKYQEEAISSVLKGFEEEDRGKLIMPPGSGKTFCALKIAERLAGKGGYVLFLVPSIALADQSLRAWLDDADIPIRPFVVASDKSIGKNEDSLDEHTLLSVPPTTDAERLLRSAGQKDPESMTVIFSTYQSIDVLISAQERGFPEFDLIVCDEAHYTAGIGTSEEVSVFKKVHDNSLIRGRKRLYMTATPKVYSLGIKERANEEDLTVYSMDDEDIFGRTFYSYTFYRAVEEGYLSDYRLIVLTVGQKEVQERLYEYLQRGSQKVEDTAKAVGTIKALLGQIKDIEEPPQIRRAVVFCSNIRRSKTLSKELPFLTGELSIDEEISTMHIDGSMSASERKRLLDWLRSGPEREERVRVLTNARVLTEGIDVPALDCVVFFDPRKSIVDIVQAMGRVMRKAPGKTYGYVVLPVVIDEDKPIEEQLEENEGFRTIFQVASALRSLDESFTARIRQVYISDKAYGEKQEGTGGVYGEALYFKNLPADSPLVVVSDGIPEDTLRQIKQAIVPKLVERLGGRKYLETWAKDISKRVKRLYNQVDIALEKEEKIREDFDAFLSALREVINPAIREEEAKSMLVQHMITKPVFTALFEGYDFLEENPVSQAMEKVARHFENFLKAETQDLEDFYREVRIRAMGIDKEEERQEFLRRLYDSFFKHAFPDTADKMGIAYTPVELVDFLINSVEDLLEDEFGTSLNDEDVIVLEPFAGTGTFLVRLMHKLDPSALKRKYSSGEVWGNEILLLPYYIALTNIETAYYEITKEVKPFRYLLLTDTFELEEKRLKGHQLSFGFFPESYSQLMQAQNKAKVNVIISNPPWRAKQEDMTDLNFSLKYERLDEKIGKTYSALSKAKNKNALYDSYVRAVRYASDRIGERGVIAFVLNNGFLDSNSFDGFRKALAEEFKKIYVYNLRGNAHTQGELRRQEGDGVFGEASRAGVALLILVKDKKEKKQPTQVFYYQVRDYMKREEKLEELRAFSSYRNVPWQVIEPDEDGSWINKGEEEFKQLVSVEDIFEKTGLGITTGRDAWVYDFSKEKLRMKMERFIKTFNEELERVRRKEVKEKEELISDPTRISWSHSLINYIFRKTAELQTFEGAGEIRRGTYRPFVSMWLYFSRIFIHSPSISFDVSPSENAENLIMFFTGTGANKDFSALVSKHIIECGTFANTNAIPLYLYLSKENLRKKKGLFDSLAGRTSKKLSPQKVILDGREYYRVINIKEDLYRKLAGKYGVEFDPEEVFFYVYAFISNPEYGKKYANNLRREKPRVAFPEDYGSFKKLSEFGKALAILHADYESAPEWELEVEIKGDLLALETYFPDIRLSKEDPSVLIYNDYITIRGIPEEVYKWKLAGRSPLEWLAEYLKPRKDKSSGWVIDPADYIRETQDREYFIRLIKKVVYVSVETIRLWGKQKEEG